METLYLIERSRAARDGFYAFGHGFEAAHDVVQFFALAEAGAQRPVPGQTAGAGKHQVAHARESREGLRAASMAVPSLAISARPRVSSAAMVL